jgi:hypothetical protein
MSQLLPPENRARLQPSHPARGGPASDHGNDHRDRRHPCPRCSSHPPFSDSFGEPLHPPLRSDVGEPNLIRHRRDKLVPANRQSRRRTPVFSTETRKNQQPALRHRKVLATNGLRLRSRSRAVWRNRSQLKVLTSTCRPRVRASSTIASNRRAVASSIHSSPHCEQTVAGVFRTTITPAPSSAVNVVAPPVFVPPQRGQTSLRAVIIVFWSDSRTQILPSTVRRR